MSKKTISILPESRFIFGQGELESLGSDDFTVTVDGQSVDVPVGKELQVSSKIKTLLKDDKIHTSVVEQIPGNRIKIVRKK